METPGQDPRSSKITATRRMPQQRLAAWSLGAYVLPVVRQDKKSRRCRANAVSRLLIGVVPSVLLWRHGVDLRVGGLMCGARTALYPVESAVG